MGKAGEKESTERKFPFYSFQLFVPPQKSGLMGLGEKKQCHQSCGSASVLSSGAAPAG